MLSIKINKSIKSAIIYTIGTLLVQGINYITLPIFAKLMPTEAFGIYSSYENWVAIISVFLGLQTCSSITNAYNDYKSEELTDYSATVSIVGWVCFALLCLGTYLFRYSLQALFELEAIYLFIGLLQSLFAYFLTVLLNEYRVQDKATNYLVFSCLNTIITVAASLIFVVSNPEKTYVGRIYGTSLSAAVVGIASLLIIYSKGKVQIQRDYIKYALVLCAPLVFHSLAGIIMGKIDQMMLLKMTSASDMGVYSYGNKLAHIVYVLYTAINKAFIPWYYKARKNKNYRGIQIVVINYIRVFMVVCGCLIFLIPEIIRIISQPSYYGAVYTAPLIIGGFYYNFLYVFPSTYEFYLKKTKYIAIGTVISAIINTMLNWRLIPVLGGIGAALATCCSYLFLMIMHLLISKKVIGEYEISTKPFIVYGLMFGGILGIYYMTINFLVVRLVIVFVLGIWGISQVRSYQKNIG